jgi:hypothetical protein
LYLTSETLGKLVKAKKLEDPEEQKAASGSRSPDRSPRTPTLAAGIHSGDRLRLRK